MKHKYDFLLEEAREAAKLAYCPYSKFHVGSAVFVDGEIYTGCNIENASYGLSNCSERTAIFKAVSDGHRKLEAIAVTCPDAGEDSPDQYKMPCGACRQVISEFMDEDGIVLIDRVGEFKVSDLLPKPFKL